MKLSRPALAYGLALATALSAGCAYDWTVGAGDGGVEGDGGSGPTMGLCGPSCACPPSTTCIWTCSPGKCRETCAAKSTCTGACSGGGCVQTCPPDATCVFACSGGGCTQDCATGSTCNLACSGDSCVRTYPAGANVTQDNCPTCTCNGRQGCP